MNEADNENTGRRVGYARVSKHDQDLALQLDELKAAGCPPSLIFKDQVSGARKERPGLDKCLAELRPGDTLLVWRIDRLGRSLSHLVALIEDLHQRGVGFRSIRDGVMDTTTASGEMIFNIISTLAHFERRLIQERTRAGLQAARARGRSGGRKQIGPGDPRVKTAKALHQDKNLNVGEICKTMGISRATFYRYLNTG